MSGVQEHRLAWRVLIAYLQPQPDVAVYARSDESEIRHTGDLGTTNCAVKDVF